MWADKSQYAKIDQGITRGISAGNTNPKTTNITIKVNETMHLITVHIPEAYLDGLDSLVTERVYPNRSEAIRVAVRDLLKTELSIYLRNKQDATSE